jgi:hypothetical protein
MNFCIISGDRICDKHHLITRGAGGSDHENNIIYLCRAMHTKVHAIGLRKFSTEYPVVMYWLFAHGWVMQNNEWVAPPECRKELTKVVRR